MADERPEDAPEGSSAVSPLRAKRVRWVEIGLLGVVILCALVYQVVASRRSPICIVAHDTLSGPSGAAGREAVDATQIYIDEVNRSGGVNGHPIEIVQVDDQGYADTARDNVKKIADSSCLAVLGHRLSTTSLAAGPGYKAAHIPALTGATHVDELTIDNPWYFRAQNTASTQGRSIAEYLRLVMGAPQVHLVASGAKFDRNFARGFASAYDRSRVSEWSFDSDSATRANSASAMAADLARSPQSGIIILGTGEDSMPDVLRAVRRQGITSLVIASTSAGHEQFLHRFDEDPEEKWEPGFFSQNLYAIAPLIFDSAGAEAQAFGTAYLDTTGRTPGWIAASTYEAARVMVEALRRAKVSNKPGTVAQDREHVRAALASMDRPERGVRGFQRMLYFDAQQSMPRPIRLGFFRKGRFVSLPQQLVLVESPELLDLDAEREQGHIVASAGRYYWRQRVVYTGIDVNRVNRLDVKDGSFDVDLNLWMRYDGDDDAPTHVEFPALLDRGAFDATKPVEASQEGGLAYRLYRIVGSFKNNYDLHDYPFDRQQLMIRFQNRQQRSEIVTYAVDRFGLALADGNRAAPTDQSPYSILQQWQLVESRYFVDSLSSTSTLGKPSRFGSDVRTEFAGFNLVISLQRNARIYVIKTMIPLLLLVMVVFATLFLPGNLFRERINIPVTAILTSAVLLLSVNNQLGDIGYTITIEYIFYAFFFLCLVSMLIGIMHDSLSIQCKFEAAAALERNGQFFYVVTVIAVIVYFWWRYAG